MKNAPSGAFLFGAGEKGCCRQATSSIDGTRQGVKPRRVPKGVQAVELIVRGTSLRRNDFVARHEKRCVHTVLGCLDFDETIHARCLERADVEARMVAFYLGRVLDLVGQSLFASVDQAGALKVEDKQLACNA